MCRPTLRCGNRSPAARRGPRRRDPVNVKALKRHKRKTLQRFNPSTLPTMPENLWFILLIIAASIVRWLWQKAVEEKEKADRPDVPDQPIPRSGESQSEEERIRRFLEALGQPPGTTPPPKVAHK